MYRTYTYPNGPAYRRADAIRAERIRRIWHAVADWADDQAGDSSDGPLWAGLSGRRVATEDSHGFRNVFTFTTTDEARAFLASVATAVTPGWRDA